MAGRRTKSASAKPKRSPSKKDQAAAQPASVAKATKTSAVKRKSTSRCAEVATKPKTPQVRKASAAGKTAAGKTAAGKTAAGKPRRRSTAKKQASEVIRAEPKTTLEEVTSPERRLDTILRALPDKELTGLIERMGIRVDINKRIDIPAQIARALVRVLDVREPSRLPAVSGELLRRIAEANGFLVLNALPAGVEALARGGIVYARMGETGIELILPTAFLVQMKSWEGEDPRCIRALLAQAPFETASAVATHYLGRPSTPPIALSLEPAWETLGDPATLTEVVANSSHQERRLLDQIEMVGGEVDTQELMDLEREPMRVRGAYGAAAGRRGAAFSLEKRGLLFPLHPNRYVLPTEVAALIGAERRREREQRREEIREHVIEEDHLPRRAKFSLDAAPFAVALTIGLREGRVDVKPGVGTPRSLVTRLAQRFGREGEPTALVIALARAIGLWEPSLSSASPPGSLPLSQLGSLLFETWRKGGAWDEARPDPEMMRLAPDHRDPSPTGMLREMILDALQDLGEGQWVPYPALLAYLDNNPRSAGLQRLLQRWGKRVGLQPPLPRDIAQRILLNSLPVLGVVDLGGADIITAASGSGELKSLALRLTERGRQLIGGDRNDRMADQTKLEESRLLCVGGDAIVVDVLNLTGFVDVQSVDSALRLAVSQASTARGLAAGIEASLMEKRVAALVPLSEELGNALKQAGTIIGRSSLTPVSGFLWIEDQEVRDLLASAPVTSDLFIDPSPRGGLLVAPGVDRDRLSRRCRALGVTVEIQEPVMRARRSNMPPARKSDSHESVSWRPPSRRKRDS